MNVELISEADSSWEECEARLDERGTPLPLYHRAIWARAASAAGLKSFLVAIRDEAGDCRAAFAVESSRSRAMPGHRLLSIPRFGVGSGGLDSATLEHGLDALVSWMRRDRLALRATIDVYATDATDRVLTTDALRRFGFNKVPTIRSYERTLVLDLTPDEDALFAGLRRNARQRVRNITKFPVRLSTARSPEIAPRLQALADETRRRTGGDSRPVDWRSFIELSTSAPDRSRIATLERTDVTGPDALIAFAWGVKHGDVAEYSESGSVRIDEMNIPTSYALLWDLITWARRSGAKQFDLGGVTSGNAESEDDPLGGISDFKRGFSKHEIEVGEQWEFTPRPFRAAAARGISQTAAVLSSVFRRVKKLKTGDSSSPPRRSPAD